MAKRDDSAIAELRMRIKENLRGRLEDAASLRGRTLNHEVVDRLEGSFERQQLVVDGLDLLCGRRAAGVLLALAHAIRLASSAAASLSDKVSVADDWLDDAWATAQVAEAIERVLDELLDRRPDKPAAEAPRKVRVLVDALPETARDGVARVGVGTANSILAAIRGHPVTRSLEQAMAPVRERLVDEDTRKG
jgi:hypothetical protein